MFEFTGLRTLHKDMMKKGEERATFPFGFNGKIFSCIFLTDIIPYRLYLTTLGLYPVVFELEIEKGYKAKCFIDDYRKLVDYLEIKYDPTHKFVPLDFFEALNKRIPKEFMMRPDYKETLKIASKKEKLKKKLRYIFVVGEGTQRGRMYERKILKKREAHLEMQRQKCVKEKILVPVGQIVPMKKN